MIGPLLLVGCVVCCGLVEHYALDWDHGRRRFWTIALCGTCLALGAL